MSGFLSNSPNWVPPPPPLSSARQHCSSPSLGPSKGGDTLACGGRGGPNSDDGTDTLVLSYDLEDFFKCYIGPPPLLSPPYRVHSLKRRDQLRRRFVVSERNQYFHYFPAFMNQLIEAGMRGGMLRWDLPRRLSMGVTKRCRLSLLTNSALVIVYESRGGNTTPLPALATWAR